MTLTKRTRSWVCPSQLSNTWSSKLTVWGMMWTIDLTRLIKTTWLTLKSCRDTLTHSLFRPLKALPQSKSKLLPLENKLAKALLLRMRPMKTRWKWMTWLNWCGRTQFCSRRFLDSRFLRAKSSKESKIFSKTSPKIIKRSRKLWSSNWTQPIKPSTLLTHSFSSHLKTTSLSRQSLNQTSSRLPSCPRTLSKKSISCPK